MKSVCLASAPALPKLRYLLLLSSQTSRPPSMLERNERVIRQMDLVVVPKGLVHCPAIDSSLRTLRGCGFRIRHRKISCHVLWGEGAEQSFNTSLVGTRAARHRVDYPDGLTTYRSIDSRRMPSILGDDMRCNPHVLLEFQLHIKIHDFITTKCGKAPDARLRITYKMML
jgi:hypothetical protein